MPEKKRISKGSFALINNGAVTDVFNFQYNPTERGVRHTVNYAKTSPPGSALPQASFTSIDGPTWALTLFLDSTNTPREEENGILAQKAFLEMLVQPDINNYLADINSYTPPPEVLYTMGGVSARVLVESVSFRDVRFNRLGVETRAYVEIDFFVPMTEVALLTARLQRLQNLAKTVTISR